MSPKHDDPDNCQHMPGKTLPGKKETKFMPITHNELDNK